MIPCTIGYGVEGAKCLNNRRAGLLFFASWSGSFFSPFSMICPALGLPHNPLARDFPLFLFFRD